MSLYDALNERLKRESGAALATVVAGPDGLGTKILIDPDGTLQGAMRPKELTSRVTGDALDLLAKERSETRTYDTSIGVFDVFINVFPVPRTVLIVGATHVAIPLSQFARQLGYRVIITDARSAFALRDRFPNADEVIKGWPQDVLPTLRLDEATYVVLLSHDPKFDEPALDIVLRSPIAYVGAIGSRKTQVARRERLRNEGFTEDDLSHLYGPVGLDIGGVTVEETALAIMAEIIAVRHARLGGSLRQRFQTASPVDASPT